MKDTSRLGTIGELVVATKLIKKGYNVSIPLGSISDYDLIIEKDGLFNRVQCKTGQLLNDSVIKFRPCTVLRTGESKDYRGRADYFGVHLADKVYLVPVDKCGTGACHLRLTEAKNNQKKRLMLAKDFELN